MSVGPQIRALIVAHDELGAALLASFLDGRPEMTVVGRASSLRRMQVIATVVPDVIVLAGDPADATGTEACRVAKARWPTARVLAMCGPGRDEEVLELFQAGADGCLLKTAGLAELEAGIRATVHRLPVVPAALLGRIAVGLAAPRKTRPRIAALTPRELEVLKLLAAGRSTRLIALELGMAQGTVRFHVEAIRRKFGVTTKLEAVSLAIVHHIVELVPRAGEQPVA